MTEGKMTEHDLQRQCNEFLRKRGIRYLHIEKGRGRNMTHRKGWPDLLVFPGFGKVIFVELKKPGGTLKPEQTAFRDEVREYGYQYSVCYSTEEFIKVVEGLWL